MKKLLLLFAVLLTTVGAWAQEAETVYLKVSHEGWVVKAQNQYGTVKDNGEGGLAHIADDDPRTFYHSDYSGSQDGNKGKQGFLVEMKEEVSNIARITYAGRSDNNASGWASKVRIYIYESLPTGFPEDLSQLSVAEKNTLFDNTALLGTPVYNNSENPWAKEDKQMKTADFAGVSGKYILFIQDEGRDSWLTCSDFQVYFTALAEQCTLKYEYYYKGAKKDNLTQEFEAKIGQSFPAPTAQLPNFVSVSTPESVIYPADVVEGVVTKRIDINDNLPFEVSEDFNSAKWYYMTIHATEKSYLYYDESKTYLDASKTAVDFRNADAYRWAFIGNPFDGFKFVNKKAGNSMVLTSTEPTSDAIYPIMGEGDKVWYLTSSSYGTNGFFVAFDSGSTKRLNRQNKEGLKVCYWLGGADAGSTFMVEECQKPHVEVMNYIDEFQSKYELLSLGWKDKVGYCTSQSLENLKVALESANALVKATSVLPKDKTISIGKMQQQMVPGRWYFIHTPRVKNTNVGANDYAVNGIIQSKGGLVTDNTNAVKVSATSVIDALKNTEGVNANDYLKHLVRFVAVDDVEGAYRIEFGTEKWMGADCGATQADVNNAGQYNFYLTETDGVPNTLGRFGWNKHNLTNRVDNNGAGEGLSFWESGKVTATAGNNVWEIFEVNVHSVTAAESENAIATLIETVQGLETIQPQEGKFYNIVSSCTKDHRANQQVYVDNSGVMHFAKTTDALASSMGHVFQFVPGANGKFKIYNVERGVYMQSVGTASETNVNNAKLVTITNMGKDNIVSIKPDGQNQMHAQDKNSVIVAWNNNAYDDGSAWKIVEIADINAVSHPVTIGNVKWATLVLGYNAVIPEGIKAYAVSGVDAESASLDEVMYVIPANEAVLLNGAAKTYEFKYSASASPVESNLLKGTVFDANITADSYVLSAPEGVVGLYKAEKNLAENTAFKNNAFKAYLPKPEGSNSRFFVFDFGGTETGIVEIENGNVNAENSVVYDLAGRRVQKAQKGLYIVNGKKVVK